MDFTGLSAFAPTPFVDGAPDEAAFRRIVGGLATSGVDSIGALGSTGHYAYLSLEERVRLARAAVQEAGDVPVLVSIGAPATRAVLELADGVQAAGASGVLLAPVSYQRLTRAEVLGLYRDACAELSVPLCLYDNPGTTGFTFDDELYAQIAALSPVASVKIPGVPLGPGEAAARVAQLRGVLPAGVSIGVSGDQSAAAGLLAGCDAWYSVIAGSLPGPALRLARAGLAGDAEATRAADAAFSWLWALFTRRGSARVAAAVATQLGLGTDFLPRPLLPLGEAEQAEVAEAIAALEAAVGER
ncbi:MAG: dihydrodipicolinate synthase family protein [Arthrobacter sp.]|jgi:4-hydroxy-tetrahydrodipicolinate synthase|nr:dihydrodipicolinate synthase family protein [Arthrobacter sp.]